MNSTPQQNVRRFFGRAQASLRFRTRRPQRAFQKSFVEPYLYGALVRLRSGVVETTVGQRKVKYAARSWREVVRARTFMGELGHIERLEAEARPGDVVWDVGAHAGWYTVPLAFAVGAQGCVVSFEPVPEIAAETRRSARLNRLSNVTVIQKALSDRSFIGRMALHDVGVSGGHSLVFQHGGKTIDVPVVSGDSLVASGEAPAPNMMKIDVEGAEEAVVRGCAGLLRNKDLRVILCEVSPVEGDDIDDQRERLAGMLKSAGFNNIEWSRRGRQFHVLATRSAGPDNVTA